MGLGDVQERLAATPHAFDFRQALRLLQALHPERPRIGESIRIEDDFVRLRQQPDLRFAPATLHEFTPGGPDWPSMLSVYFLGLLGPNGPMPLPLTAHALDRINQRDEFRGRLDAPDRTLVAFLDVLHHRALSLFFRAWAVHQKTVDLDRKNGRRFTRYFGSMIGLGMESLGNRDAVPDNAKLYFSGRLGNQVRNAEGLSAILSEFFGVSCAIQDFAGHWISIPADDVCRLGASPETGSLGTTCIIGSQLWQVQTKFRVRFGPMRYEDLLRLLPNQTAWQRIKAWVANYIGHELLWDAQYVLLAAEVPSTQLGGAAFLGWTTWITTNTPACDADDVVLDADLH